MIIFIKKMICDGIKGNVRLCAPVDYVLSVNNIYSVLQRMGCIRHGADNRIWVFP